MFFHSLASGLKIELSNLPHFQCEQRPTFSTRAGCPVGVCKAWRKDQTGMLVNEPYRALIWKPPTQITSLARSTAESPNEPLLAHLRILEKKMGLVLTLVNQTIL